MPLTKFIAPHDPLWLSTLDALGNELVSDSLVLTYANHVAFISAAFNLDRALG
ncbi:hypothetical protein ACFW2D_02935 [Streptomyces sp. NPDC058914]|uniref:hypothetical protein n=1 Tax=Streptomyces TaxID=1883 RepID=UPI0036A87CAF